MPNGNPSLEKKKHLCLSFNFCPIDEKSTTEFKGTGINFFLNFWKFKDQKFSALFFNTQGLKQDILKWELSNPVCKGHKEAVIGIEIVSTVELGYNEI
jgi:hypothetical protein